MSDQPMNNISKVIPFPHEGSIESQAAHWLAALDVDNPSAETVAAFNTWIRADKAHRAEFERVVSFWSDLNILTQVRPPRSVNKKVASINWFYGFGSIAAIFLVVVLFHFFTPREISYITGLGEQRTIELSDKTMVFLNTNSQILVSYTRTHRTVHLQRGEALFEVAHDKTKPFEVIAGERIVRAVGTAFSVFLKNDEVQVLVAEGIVEIDNKPVLHDAQGNRNVPVENPKELTLAKKEKVRVPAGNKALFNKKLEEAVLVTELKRIEDKLTWHTGVLTFDRETLESVINELGRYTSTKFVMPDKDVREMIVGGVFKVGDTESLFEALKLGFGIQALEVADNVIYLSRIKD